MFNLLRRLFGSFKPINTGATGDDRTEKQKEYAYDSRELVSAYPIEWREKTEWKSYPLKRQWYTFECVAQSTTKHLSINNIKDYGMYIPLSAEFFYFYRVNRPTGGMVWSDAMKLATTRGACFDYYIKQRMRETEPEVIPTYQMEEEAAPFRGKAFIEDKERTMDSIARIIDTQGSCLVWFWFDANGTEWWRVAPTIVFPNLGTYDSGSTRHAVVATDYGLREGKKVIKIEDSAGNSSALNNQDRFIDENFMKRCFVSGYVIDMETKPQPEKPKWTGTRTLKVGSTGDDVRELQDILKYYELFPSAQKSTGYYAGLSRAGVIKLQEKFKDEILTPVGLTKGTGIVGNQTLKWLNNNHK